MMVDKWHPDKSSIRSTTDSLDPTVLQTKSNTELLQEIEEMLCSSAEEMDTDRIERYLAILQERAPVMEDYDPEAHWDKLEKDHPQIFVEDDASQDAPVPDAEKGNGAVVVPHRRPFRLLRMIEVALITALCLVVTASAFGFNPVQAILKWAEGVIQVYSNPSGIMELPAEDPSEFHSLEEALEANGIESSGLPTWVPRDYTLADVTVRLTDGLVKCTATYESERGELTIRVIKYFMADAALAEEREADGSVYLKDGVEYYLISNYEQSKAGWQIGLNSYVISGQISETELKEIIDSIA